MPAQPAQQPQMIVTGFTTATTAAQVGNTAVRVNGLQSVPLAQRGSCFASCGIIGTLVLQFFFAFANAFWFLWTQTGGETFRGYGWIVASLYALTLVEIVSACIEFGSSRTQASYALSSVGAAASGLSALLLLSLLLAMKLDYGAKCDDFKQLEDRAFSAAYPYNCGDVSSGPLLAAWTVTYLLVMVVLPKLLAFCFVFARCGWHRFDHMNLKAAAGGGLDPLLGTVPQSSDAAVAASAARCTPSDWAPALVLALLATTALSTGFAGLFINGQRSAPGHCPGPAANFTDPDGIAATVFRPEPVPAPENLCPSNPSVHPYLGPISDTRGAGTEL